MSADLYAVRVYFEAYTGCVKYPGLYRNINKPPEIPGLPKLTAIDYAPGAFAGTLQAWAGQRREMTVTEAGCVNQWLQAVLRGEA